MTDKPGHQSGDQSASTVVDVHTHVFPPGLGDLASETGDPRWPRLVVDETSNAEAGSIMCGPTVFRRVTNQCWELNARLAAMDQAGVDVQVLSAVPIMLAAWSSDNASIARFAHEQNEAIANLISASSQPRRFRWLGAVPVRDAVRAEEVLRAGVGLGMCGVQIGSAIGGEELDHPDLRGFWRAAADHDLAVFVHPTDGEGAIRRRGQPYEFGLGMLTDTAQAAASLVFGGVLEEFPSLRVGFAHGCGTLPWALPRLTRAATLPGAPRLPAPVANLVRRLWADTLVFDPAHVALLVARFGADHLMLGSDHPFYPPTWGDPLQMLHEAAADGFCAAAHLSGLTGGNAARFLADPTLLSNQS